MQIGKEEVKPYLSVYDTSCVKKSNEFTES